MAKYIGRDTIGCYECDFKGTIDFKNGKYYLDTYKSLVGVIIGGK